MEDFLEAIHSEESQSGMQKAFSVFGFLHWFSSEEIRWNSNSSSRKYEAYDLVRHGPRARYEQVVRPLRKNREARCALNRFQKTGLDVDKATYREKGNEYKSTISEKKKQYKIITHQALLDNKRNSNKFWETVRCARRKRREQPEIDIKIWQNHSQTILGQAEKDDVQCSNS